MTGFPKLGEAPYNKDYSIGGSILGPPIFGNYHIILATIFEHQQCSLMFAGAELHHVRSPNRKP